MAPISLKHMKLPDEDIAIPNIASKFKSHFEFADIVFERSKELLTGKISNPNQKHLCLFPVLTRMMRLHYCSVKLASSGFALEGKLQVRAMFENFLNVLALEYASDRTQYARRWIAWDLANHMKQVSVYLKDKPELNEITGNRKEILNDIKKEIEAENRVEGERLWPSDQKRVAKYVKTRWNIFVSKGPSMQNLRDLAGALDKKIPERSNFQRTYDQFYAYASGVAHGSDLESLIHSDKLEQNKIVLKMAPSTDDIDALVVTSSFFLGRVAASASRVLLIGSPNFSTTMQKILHEAEKKFSQ